MKKKNMIKLCKNISKIKYVMVDRWSIIDDYDLLKGLIIEDIADIQEKDIDNMVETVLYLIKNEDCFVREIENEIIIRVKKMLCNKRLNFEDMLSLLSDSNVIDSKVAYYHELEKNLSREDVKMESYLVIPITSNLQKHLFIEFDVLDYEKSVYFSEIKITNIYID